MNRTERRALSRKGKSLLLCRRKWPTEQLLQAEIAREQQRLREKEARRQELADIEVGWEKK